MTEVWLNSYFTTLWLSDTDYQVWFAIFQFGPKPVSTIASMVGVDRTYAYRIIDRLAGMWLIQASVQWWVKHYATSSPRVVRELVRQRMSQLQQLDDEFDQVESQMQQLIRRSGQTSPLFRTREWLDAVSRMYERMIQQIRSDGILSLHLFSGSTLSSQITAYSPFAALHHDFCQTCLWSKILLESTIADGILLMDHIAHYSDWDVVKNLAIWQGSLVGYVIGHTWYLVMFHDVPRAFSIDHPQVAELMVLLLRRSI
jgi:predicted transcriptional regulator